jgi:hybrid cluster-associated redox disulfide protein
MPYRNLYRSIIVIMKIDRETNIGELTQTYPESTLIMLDYGLHCVGCAINSFDTIQTGAQIHGMDDQEIEEMLGKIREAIGES